MLLRSCSIKVSLRSSSLPWSSKHPESALLLSFILIESLGVVLWRRSSGWGWGRWVWFISRRCGNRKNISFRYSFLEIKWFLKNFFLKKTAVMRLVLMRPKQHQVIIIDHWPIYMIYVQLPLLISYPGIFLAVRGLLSVQFLHIHT